MSKVISYSKAKPSSVLAAVICWALFSPLRFLPRRRDWIAVIGRADGKFVDNAKYFFLEAHQLLKGSAKVAFITDRVDVTHLLRDANLPVLRHFTLHGIWFLLRAGTVIVDSTEWTRHGRCYLLLGAKKVQMWHGVGYKRIEMDLWRHMVPQIEGSSNNSSLRTYLIEMRVLGRLPVYDLLIAPSMFYLNNVFKQAFLSRNYIICGYPRSAFNTIGKEYKESTLLNADTNLIAKARDWIVNGSRVVLVAPTFRDSGEPAISMTMDQAALVERWCEAHRVELVLKFHPNDIRSSIPYSRHLHVYQSTADIYPFLLLSSALITDHSSIYMDYLHLDKPIIFFQPVNSELIKDERPFQFDRAKMTPGPVTSSWDEALELLGEELDDDHFCSDRAKLREFAFDNIQPNMAVETIVRFMRSRQWIPMDSE